MITSEY